MVKQNFKAAMFDYDGTLTDPYFASSPPESLRKTLQQLSMHAHFAICSGAVFSRVLEKLRIILGERFEELQSRWVLISENGGAGYKFDTSTQKYVEFYRALWPENLYSRKKFEQEVNNFFIQYTDYISVNPSCVILRPRGWEILGVEELTKAADELEIHAKEFLRRTGADAFLEIGNPAMGIILCLKNGNKDRGIEEFGKFLKLESPFREILIVGDRPYDTGNDAQFLSGKFGVPFTVGRYDKKFELPKPVADESGERLMGPLATQYLLKHFEFGAYDDSMT